MTAILRFGRIERPAGADERAMYLTGYLIDDTDGRVIAIEDWLIAIGWTGKHASGTQSFREGAERLAHLACGINDSRWALGKNYAQKSLEDEISAGFKRRPVSPDSIVINDNGSMGCLDYG